MADKRIGWYSSAQASLEGYSIWTNEAGEEVRVTEVTNGDFKPPTEWEPLRRVGVVIKHVRSHFNDAYMNGRSDGSVSKDGTRNKPALVLTEWERALVPYGTWISD